MFHALNPNPHAIPEDRRQHYAVGPGPVTIRSWFDGEPDGGLIPPGLYAVAYDDQRGPILSDARLYRTREDADRAADWASVPD